VELGSTDQVLRFPPKNPKDPERLSESTFLFKKSCFLNTSPEQRLAALEECRTGHALGGRPTGAGEKLEDNEPQKPTRTISEAEKAEMEQLAAMLAKPVGPRRKFF